MKALSLVRDIAVIVGVIVVCGLLVDARLTKEHERRARLTMTTEAITKLESLYKQAVFDASENKGIYQQMFRQNEIALEYQKLLLVRDLLSTAGVDPDAPPKPAGTR